MSALYRMAFSEHKQINIDAGDRIIISASAIPGNETTVSKVIDELFHKARRSSMTVIPTCTSLAMPRRRTRR